MVISQTDESMYSFILPNNTQSDIESFIQEFGLEVTSFETCESIIQNDVRVYTLYMTINNVNSDRKWMFSGYITDVDEDYILMNWNAVEIDNSFTDNLYHYGPLSALINNHIL